MSKMIVILGVTLGSCVGWWIGEKIGMLTGVWMSSIGAGAGLYFSRRFIRNLLD